MIGEHRRIFLGLCLQLLYYMTNTVPTATPLYQFYNPYTIIVPIIPSLYNLWTCYATTIPSLYHRCTTIILSLNHRCTSYTAIVPAVPPLNLCITHENNTCGLVVAIAYQQLMPEILKTGPEYRFGRSLCSGTYSRLCYSYLDCVELCCISHVIAPVIVWYRVFTIMKSADRT